MRSKNKTEGVIGVLFVLYVVVVLNWPNYTENTMTGMICVMLGLAITIVWIGIKSIRHREKNGWTKVGIGLILLCTLAPIILSFAVLLGYVFQR